MSTATGGEGQRWTDHLLADQEEAMAAEPIAVIDDDATFLEMMDLLLTDEGYRTLLRPAVVGAGCGF